MSNKFHFNYLKKLISFYWQDLNAYFFRKVSYFLWPILEFLPIMFLMGIISQSPAFTYTSKEIYLYYFFVWALFYNVNQHWQLFYEFYYGNIAECQFNFIYNLIPYLFCKISLILFVFF